ncbi:MAG: hypothetical protein JOY85_06795, partial [Acidobacteriaceae bacterium]|nr:hypothetical protein [Acidobacteriaceae bacterium]
MARKEPMKPVNVSSSATIVIALLVCPAPFARAQQTPNTKPEPPAFTPPQPTPNDTLRSPEVGSNGHVTFRLYAPDAR